MLLITALKDASRVSVDVVRNRVPVRIRYEIH